MTQQTTVRVAEHGPGLIVTVGSRACAIPLLSVGETMRPLPIVPVAGMPAFVLGVSVIRGAAIPVVDLRALLGDDDRGGSPGRFVTLNVGERRVAIAVDGVVGLRDLSTAPLAEMPPLLGEAAAELIAAIGICDAQLLVVLRTVQIVPEQVWRLLDARESA